MMKEEFIIAVDIGGSLIRSALCDLQGSILCRYIGPTPATETASEVTDWIEQSISKVWPSSGNVKAIGFAAPGPLDPWKGVILHSPNIPNWDNYPLRQIIQEKFDVPIQLNDDGNAAALAEQRFGAGRGCVHVIYITISTGVGNGIIVDNRLLLGAHGLAAEIDHMMIREDAPIQCGCDSRGCLESLISEPSLAEQAHLHLIGGEKSCLTGMVQGNLALITTRMVKEAASSGDELTLDIFHKADYNLGVALVSLLYIFNPEIVIIGRSVRKAGDLVLEPA